jgi:hypothetical protein
MKFRQFSSDFGETISRVCEFVSGRSILSSNLRDQIRLHSLLRQAARRSTICRPAPLVQRIPGLFHALIEDDITAGFGDAAAV